MKPKFTTNQSGSVTLLGTITALTAVVFLFGIVQITLGIHQKIALQDRLDICTLKILFHYQKTLHKLSWLNRKLLVLQSTIYVARNAKYIPVISVPSNITEKTALTLARGIYLTQKALLVRATQKSLMLGFCQRNQFSKEPSICSYPPINSGRFSRKQALYPDVPGLLIIKPNFQNFKIRCTAISLKAVAHLQARIHSKPTAMDVKYEFQ